MSLLSLEISVCYQCQCVTSDGKISQQPFQENHCFHYIAIYLNHYPFLYKSKKTQNEEVSNKVSCMLLQDNHYFHCFPTHLQIVLKQHPVPYKIKKPWGKDVQSKISHWILQGLNYQSGDFKEFVFWGFFDKIQAINTKMHH